jgi:mRNA interferase RelE/StbE
MADALQFKPAALREFEKLPRDIQKRIAVKIAGLRGNLFPGGCKKLSGIPDAWRIRVGDYRVVYQVKRSILLVLVLTVGNRRDVYR